MPHDSSIEANRRAAACRQFAHQRFAADLELGTEADFLCPDEAVRRENAPRTLRVRASKSLRRKGSTSTSIPLSLSAPSVRRTHWHEFSNAPHGNLEGRRFRITHPYHPLFQQEFEAVTFRQNWGEDRVWFHDQNGRLQSVPTSWTDAAAVDAFVVVAAGRSLFRVVDLLELTQRIQAAGQDRREECKEKDVPMCKENVVRADVDYSGTDRFS